MSLWYVRNEDGPFETDKTRDSNLTRRRSITRKGRKDVKKWVDGERTVPEVRRRRYYPQRVYRDFLGVGDQKHRKISEQELTPSLDHWLRIPFLLSFSLPYSEGSNPLFLRPNKGRTEGKERVNERNHFGRRYNTWRDLFDYTGPILPPETVGRLFLDSWSQVVWRSLTKERLLVHSLEPPPRRGQVWDSTDVRTGRGTNVGTLWTLGPGRTLKDSVSWDPCGFDTDLKTQYLWH